jgi:putative zinc finger/helix-turn-helix YgiT family protein
MAITCIECGQANLEPKTVQLPGAVRGETFAVEMDGLECPRCGYKTIEGARMPEYGRLLADKYRARHGVLTSDEIRERRKRLGLTQEQFATHLGVGVASIKRWEMGKIQDSRNNELIIEKTRPAVTAVWEWIGAHGCLPIIVSSTSSIFRREAASDVSTIAYPDVVLGRPLAEQLAAQPSEVVREYIKTLLGSGEQTVLLKQTGSGLAPLHLDFESQHQTVYPNLPSLASQPEEPVYA